MREDYMTLLKRNFREIWCKEVEQMKQAQAAVVGTVVLSLRVQ
jgi:hypothetical protein